MVIDYRSFDERTIGDAYPLSNITDIIDQLGGAQYFSMMVLASVFHRTSMDADSIEKSAFTTPYYHLEITRMPFELKKPLQPFKGYESGA